MHKYAVFLSQNTPEARKGKTKQLFRKLQLSALPDNANCEKKQSALVQRVEDES
jgi:hypothetical protein